LLTLRVVEKIKDISKVEAGDFLSHNGKLMVVTSVEWKGNSYEIKVDEGDVIDEKVVSRLEFFRILTRQ
jgi:hypothetical protein